MSYLFLKGTLEQSLYIKGTLEKSSSWNLTANYEIYKDILSLTSFYDYSCIF